MMFLMRSALFMLAVFCAIVFAKSADSLKTELQNFIPQGMQARLAWSQGGTVLNYRSGDKIYVCDSENGIVRELVPGQFQGQIAGQLYHPHITQDGSRVIFTEQGSNTIWVINWDGTGLDMILDGSYGSDYYYDEASQTDWIVRNDDNSYTSNLKRVNIDATNSTEPVWTRSSPRGDADDGIGVSSDGLYFASYFFNNTNGGLAGVALIPDGSVTYAEDAQTNRGCVLSIAPDNHDFMHQEIPHEKVLFYDGDDGSSIGEYDITAPILTWAQDNGKKNTCYSNEEHQATRWSSTHRDYITAMMEFTSVNPFIFKLSTMEWMYISDGTDCETASDMDLRIAASFDGTSVISPAELKARRLAEAARNTVYGLDGRILKSGAAKARGIVIRRIDNRAVAGISIAH